MQHLRRWTTTIATMLLVSSCATRPQEGCRGTLTCSIEAAGGSAGEAAAGGSVGKGGTSGAAGEAGAPAEGSLQATVAPIVRVQSGASGTLDIEVSRGAATGKLAITAAGLPAGVTAPAATIEGGSSAGQLTFQTTGSAAIGGPYSLSVTVSSSTDSSVSVESKVSLYVTGAPGQLDTSVNSAATLKASALGGDIPVDATMDAAGHTFLVGSGKNASGVAEGWAIRLTTDCRLDATFATSGVAAGFGTPPDYALKIAQNGTGLFVWATAEGTSGVVQFIRKLTTDGTIATDFAAATGGDLVTVGVGAPSALIPFGNGVLAMGAPPGRPFAVLKNGTIDSSFIAPSGTNAQAITLDDDGRVLFGEVRADGFAVGRLLAKGASDATFGASGVVVVPSAAGTKSTRFVSILTAADGSSLGLIQSQTASAATDTAVRLLGLTASGTSNGSFGNAGTVLVPAAGTATVAYGAALQKDGRVVVLYGDWIASTQTTLYRLARYDATGTLDPTFGNKGIVDLSAASPGLSPQGMAFDPFGNRVVVFGSKSNGIMVQRIWL